MAPFSRVGVRRLSWRLAFYLISQSTIAANKRAFELSDAVLAGEDDTVF